MTKLTYARDGQEYSVEAESLPPTSIAYLLQYGLSQSLQDCIAGRAKAVRDEFEVKVRKEFPADADDRLLDARNDGTIDAAVAADLRGTLLKRLDAIKAGTVGTRMPAESLLPGHTPTFVRVAKEWLAAYAKAKGSKLPKADSDDYRALLQKYAQARGDAIADEAARRDLTVAADLDLDL